MKRLVSRSTATRDIDEILDYLVKAAGEIVARRFLIALATTLSALQAFSARGAPWKSRLRRLRGIRWFAVQGFHNHLLFNRVTKSPDILRVLSAHRELDPLLRVC